MTLATHRDVEAGYSDGNSPNQMARIHLMTDQAPELLQQIEAEARRYAGMYDPHSDGRNTFVIFADWVASLTRPPSERPVAQMREALAEKFSDHFHRYRPQIFGEDDRIAGPPITRTECMNIAAALTAERPEAAVAWRWRPKGEFSSRWIYDPEPQWLEEHKHEIEAQPLYAIQHEEPGPEMIQADSIASEKVCDHPSTEKAAMSLGREDIARIIDGVAFRKRHIDGPFQNETEREKWLRRRSIAYYAADQIGPVRHCSSRVLIETLNAVRIMMKSHDRRENEEPIYVAVCQCLEFIGQSANSDGSLIANPANSLRGQPESDSLYYELMALYNASRERERELTAEVERLRVQAEPSLLGRETVREALEAARQFVDPDSAPPAIRNRDLVAKIDRALASLSPLEE